MDFFTHYNRPEKVLEKNSGEIVVDTSGYIPKNKLIESMKDAGERLAVNLATMYDHAPEEKVSENDMRLDPTRSGSFDLADAFVESKRLANLKKESDESVKDYLEQLEKEKKAAEELIEIEESKE